MDSEHKRSAQVSNLPRKGKNSAHHTNARRTTWVVQRWTSNKDFAPAAFDATHQELALRKDEKVGLPRLSIVLGFVGLWLPVSPRRCLPALSGSPSTRRRGYRRPVLFNRRRWYFSSIQFSLFNHFRGDGRRRSLCRTMGRRCAQVFRGNGLEVYAQGIVPPAGARAWSQRAKHRRKETPSDVARHGSYPAPIFDFRYSR